MTYNRGGHEVTTPCMEGVRVFAQACRLEGGAQHGQGLWRQFAYETGRLWNGGFSGRFKVVRLEDSAGGSMNENKKDGLLIQLFL